MAYSDRHTTPSHDPYAAHLRADPALQPVNSSSSALYGLAAVIFLIAAVVFGSTFFGSDDPATPALDAPAATTPAQGEGAAPAIQPAPSGPEAGSVTVPAQ